MKKGCRNFFILLLLLPVLLALLVAAGYYRLNHFANAALPGLGADARLQVEPGDSFRSVLGKLRAAGIHSGHDLEWMLLARRTGAAGKIQVGEYALTPGISPQALLIKMRDGKVVRYQFTLVEGWSMRDVRRALRRAAHLQPQTAEMSDAELMAALGKKGEHPEGRFLPETYQYNRGDSDISVLKRAYQAMEKQLQTVWEGRDPALPLKTPYELLTLASIVEKETGLADERAQIAGVFVRRLNIGMRLETDPTIIYGLGDAWNGKFTWAHLRTDGPYNTRTRAGLPPTPIAMPGPDSLKAAAHPAAGDALFFVAVGDGSGRSRFARTYAEHQRNVAAYLANRRAANAAGMPARGTLGSNDMPITEESNKP
ncbi:MAG: endolytic transglycosylase MltG [Pseudomonadota bacterium]|nr:endolytic transglycosylase MltG [Pseudomonadota bacterium]